MGGKRQKKYKTGYLDGYGKRRGQSETRRERLGRFDASKGAATAAADDQITLGKS